MSGVERLEASVDEDESFVEALYELQRAYLNMNRAEHRLPVYERIMRHIHKVPERMQYLLRADYYWLRQEISNSFAVIDMLVKLYPDDITGRRVRAYYLELQGRLNEATEEYKMILQLDPANQLLLRVIGSLYQQQGRFDEARHYYQQYADQFPDDYRAFISIGELSELMGEFDDAREYFNRALLLQPDRISLLNRLARIDFKSGRFEEALEGYEYALERSTTAEERASVYQGFTQLNLLRGRVRESFRYTGMRLSEMETYTPPFLLGLTEIEAVEQHILLGENDEAFRKVESIAGRLPDPLDDFIIGLGYLVIYLEMDEPDLAEEALPRVERYIQIFQLDSFQFLIHYARATIAELRGDYETAIGNYTTAIEMLPKILDYVTTEIDFQIGLARCYRALDDYQAAEMNLHESLGLFPVHPEIHLELSVLYAEMGDSQKASHHVTTALEVWDNPDPEYKNAIKAQEVLAGIQKPL